MGRKRRYYFPNVDPSHPTFHVAVKSKSLMEKAGEVANIFEKYADKSNPQTPKNILYTMQQQNESVLESGECASTPEKEFTSPKVKSSPESSSPGKRDPNVPILRKKLSFGDSEKYEFLNVSSSSEHSCSIMHVSPPRKNASPFSTGTDLVRASHVQHLEFRSPKASSPGKAVKFGSPIKMPKDDIYPKIYVKECSSPNDKAKGTKKDDSGSPEKVFKTPEDPDKYERKVLRPAKRPKLCESLAEIPEYVSPIKIAQTRIHSVDDDEMEISPHRDKLYESPSKFIANSPIESESPLKIETLITSVPIIIEGNIEIEKTSKSKEDSSARSVSSTESEHLIDDPSRVEWITKAVEDLLKVSISPPKTELGISPSEEKSSSLSAWKSKENVIPDIDITDSSTSVPENETSILYSPNVMTYLKSRLKSVLSRRNKCLDQVYNFVKGFKEDVNVLYLYLDCMLSTMRDIPTEGKNCSDTDLRNLKGVIISNATKLSNTLHSILNAIKEDIQFWAGIYNEIRKINEKYENCLSGDGVSQTTVEYLQEYESNLRIIWDRMDRRVFLGDGSISSLVRISDDFLMLTKDLAKYLIMVDLMKPSSMATPKENKLHITWSPDDVLKE